MREPTTAASIVEWHPFDYADKDRTKPPHDEMVWIVEEFYTDGVTLGYFDGRTFRNQGGSDDCHVSWWAEIEYPEPPARWKAHGDD